MGPEDLKAAPNAGQRTKQGAFGAQQRQWNAMGFGGAVVEKVAQLLSWRWRSGSGNVRQRG